MSITRSVILAMTLSGGLAGLAGASQVLGVTRSLTAGLSPGYGFDAIAIALVGKSHPFGAWCWPPLLFGFLRSGATPMQSLAGIPIDIISIIQALVIVFVAAPDHHPRALSHRGPARDRHKVVSHPRVGILRADGRG